MTESFDTLMARIRACRLCESRLPLGCRPVLQASPRARLLIVSQAPGRRVHETGIPFNDPSGERLRGWLGIDRAVFHDAARVAIVPMGFCFPGYDAHGSDLPPRRECAPLWRARVMAAMPQIALVLAIGQYAQGWHLGVARAASMTETVRDWRRHLGRNEGPAVLPLPHPSWRNTGWLKRNPWFEEEVLPELRNRVKTLTS